MYRVVGVRVTVTTLRLHKLSPPLRRTELMSEKYRIQMLLAMMQRTFSYCCHQITRKVHTNTND